MGRTKKNYSFRHQIIISQIKKNQAAFPSDRWFGGPQFRSVRGGEWNNPYSSRVSIPARSYPSLVTRTTRTGSRGYGV